MTMQPVHITYLNGPDIERLALTDTEILEAVRQALEAQGRGEVVIEIRPLGISTYCAAW